MRTAMTAEMKRMLGLFALIVFIIKEFHRTPCTNLR